MDTNNPKSEGDRGTTHRLDNTGKEIRNLVFAGGSVKGIAYIGAISVLSFINVLSTVRNVGGTSAGAITALCVALGLTTDKLIEVLAKVDIESLLHDEGNWLKKKDLINKSPSIITILRKSGKDELFGNGVGFPTSKIREWLEGIIMSALGESGRNLTFAMLHEIAAKQDSNKKNLFVVGYNLTKSEKKVFSWKTTPDNLIVDAVVISMSIPFVFQPSKNRIKSTDGSMIIEQDDVWVDGGIVDNYPLEIFNSEQNSTLGFYLANQDLQSHIMHHTNLPDQNANGVKNYTTAVLNALLTYPQLERHKTNHGQNSQTIYIDPGNVGMLDFGLTNVVKNRLIKSGWNATKAYFNSAEDACGPCPELVDSPCLSNSWCSIS